VDQCEDSNFNVEKGHTPARPDSASGFLSKREAQAFPLAPSAGFVKNPAPSQPPGIPQAEAIENLLYRVQVTVCRV